VENSADCGTTGWFLRERRGWRHRRSTGPLASGGMIPRDGAGIQGPGAGELACPANLDSCTLLGAAGCATHSRSHATWGTPARSPGGGARVSASSHRGTPSAREGCASHVLPVVAGSRLSPRPPPQFAFNPNARDPSFRLKAASTATTSR
jgi:hypothetical protein